MANNNNNSFFSSLLKIAIGIFLAVLVFMAYLLCEQRGWVNTNIADILLAKVEDGKAINAEAEKKAEEARKQATTKAEKEAALEKVAREEAARRERERVAAAAEAAKSAESVPAESTESDDEASDEEESTDDSSDEGTSNEGEEASDESESQEDAPAPVAAPEKKKITINYALISISKNTWPSSIRITREGTKIPITDSNGRKIGETRIPKNTRVFILDMNNNGVLTVRNANNKNQVFKIHATRTNFKKAYIAQMTATPASAPGEDSGEDSASDKESSEDSEDSANEDSDESSDDDFFDDDF